MPDSLDATYLQRPRLRREVILIAAAILARHIRTADDSLARLKEVRELRKSFEPAALPAPLSRGINQILALKTHVTKREQEKDYVYKAR